MQSDKQLIDKQHEVFCMQRDYDRAFANYRRREQPSYSPEEILFISKAAFQNEDYQRTLQLLAQLDICYSTKVLFERQSLLFRAIYLRDRKECPKDQLFKTLYEVLGQFQKYSKSTPGPPLQRQHFERMHGYRQFVAYLQKHCKSTINYNEKMHKQLLQQEKHTHKRTGFPCYLVSQQWLDDYTNMRYQVSDKVYLGPITNFAILNDIFEAYHYENPLQQHKNTYLFPTTQYKPFSKKMWAFLCGIFAGDNQFIPVRRLYRQRSSYYQTTPEIVELIPAVIDCASHLTIFQLTANELVSRELLALLDQKYGLGEVRYQPNEEVSFEYFYGGENTQKNLAEWKKILSYKRVQLPDKLMVFPIFRHFEYRPLKISTFNNPKNGLKGLQNLGNSCYMNSCLQCISFTREAVVFLTTQDTSQLLLSKRNKRQNKQDQSNRVLLVEANGEATIAMTDLLKQLWRQDLQKFVSPFKFKKYFGIRNTMFQGKTQEDAHQFLLHLLNTVHEDINQPGNLLRSTSKLQETTNVHRVKDYFIKHELQENKSMITDLFRGILHTSIHCNKCKTASHSFDLFLALSLPIPYVPSPTIKIYFSRQDARNTILYQIGLKNIKTMNDIFKVFQTQVFDVMRQSEAQAPKERQPGGGQERKKTEEDVPKKNYLLVGFSKESDPLEIWNCGFGNNLSSKQVTVDELIALGRQLILYEVKQRKMQEEQLALVEYKMNFVLSKAKVLGFPRVCYISRSTMLGEQIKPLKKAIVQKDTQNRLYESDFEEIEKSKFDNKCSIKWKLTAYFRRQERLFFGSTFVDRELNSTSEMYPLRQCFAHMGQPEILEDGWKCGHCHSKEGAEKREAIIETNNILVLCLKRFQANGSKIKNMIDYPVSGLDVTEWLEERTAFGRQVYDLYGVCLHQGTMEYGHYRAYCRHFMSGQWFEFDDERVRKVQDLRDIVSQNAYMLFYKRRDI